MGSVRTSKFLSLVLRHKPEEIGLSLDKNGWADVKDLLYRINVLNKIHGTEEFTFEELEEVVRDNNKKRFAFNEDKTKIRANQGHSIDIDLNLKAVIPPDILYHGTATRFLSSIYKNGLEKQNRQHVHLSPDPETATKVGQRHGTP